MAFGTKRCFTQLDSPDVLSGNFTFTLKVDGRR